MATSTKKLFVGGPMDGYRRNVPMSGMQYQHPVYVRRPYLPDDPDPTLSPYAASFGISTHNYNLKRCGTYEIMVHESIPDGAIMQRLIKGYHGHRNPRQNWHYKKAKYQIPASAASLP
jgi:hypothetical protein